MTLLTTPLPTLWDVDAMSEATPTTAQRAASWMLANPQAVQAFIDVAVQMHRAGQKIGAKGIVEVLRWQHAIDTDRQGEPWQWNNSHTAHIARYAMATVPDLAGFFDTRGES